MKNKNIIILISLLLSCTLLINAYTCDIRTEDILVSNNQVFFSLVLLNSTGGEIPNSALVVINSSCYDEDENVISSPIINYVDSGKWQGILTTTISGVCHFNATYDGTICAPDNTVWSMMIGEINSTAIEINSTINDIYDLLVDDINVTLTSILNLTNLTYSEILNIETNLSNLDGNLTSLRTYLVNKWGNEDADKIMEKLKEIRSDTTYLKTRYSSLTEAERDILLLALREESKAILDLIYDDEKVWEKMWIWFFPIVFFILLIIFLVWMFIKNKKMHENDFEFGGSLNEKR